VARDARPWLIAGLIGMVCTGLPQLLQNASREYFSEYFWYKMYLIAFGLILMVTVRRKATQAAEPSAFGKVVAVVSIAAWGGAVWNARLIGLFT
jgi:glucan phosphoethanolaminetransferase (alkaline phosphatase superfamily)